MRRDATATRLRTLGALLTLLGLLPDVALAHTGTGVATGFLSGFLHPLTGGDHLLAMVGVGIWGSQLGSPALWVLPVTFPLVMSVGGVLGVRGVPLPGVEIGVAMSALLLGVMVLLAARPPLAWAAALVGIFAIFHGYAHGLEIPGSASPLAFGLGFVLATGLLHVCGIALGLLQGRRWGGPALRILGSGIAVGGLYYLALAL